MRADTDHPAELTNPTRDAAEIPPLAEHIWSESLRRLSDQTCIRVAEIIKSQGFINVQLDRAEQTSVQVLRTQAGWRRITASCRLDILGLQIRSSPELKIRQASQHRPPLHYISVAERIAIVRANKMNRE